VGKGKRGLHLKCSEKEDSGEEEEEEEEEVVWLEQGEAYLTTPTFFKHAVEYPLLERWEDRVIAVQVWIPYPPTHLPTYPPTSLLNTESVIHPPTHPPTHPPSQSIHRVVCC